MSDQSGSRSQPRDALAPLDEERRGLQPRQVIGIVLAVVTLLFILQNRQDVTISLAVVDLTASLWLVTTGLVAIGILIGWLLSSRRASRKA